MWIIELHCTDNRGSTVLAVTTTSTLVLYLDKQLLINGDYCIVSLSTQIYMYNWILANLMLGVALQWTGIGE